MRKPQKDKEKIEAALVEVGKTEAEVHYSVFPLASSISSLYPKMAVDECWQTPKTLQNPGDNQ